MNLVRLRAFVACAFAAVAVGACGGADGPVPNVVGDRLDVAKSTLEDAGHDTEEIGGGTFGIIDESNWTVCETQPAAGETGDGPVKLIVDRSCDTAETTANSVAAEETDPVEDLDSSASESSARKIRVPDVVGMNHQAAQNRMQDAGLFMLDEEDATGQGRVLVWDRNWVVVSQSPAAGRRVSEDRTILLRSKKIGE